jgi:hypothetical protein
MDSEVSLRFFNGELGGFPVLRTALTLDLNDPLGSFVAAFCGHG